MAKIDNIDRHILRELQQNARMSNLELAERVNLSATPCARRVKQLEDAGIIKQHITVLDAEKLGLNLTAMISVTMDRHTADRFEKFEHAAAALPEVMECYVVTGQDSDFLIKVLVRDMRHYEEFLLRRLTKLDGVSGVHTSFVLRQPINKCVLPLQTSA
ncbi:AsnC family transcriptional regulator [Arenicella chitinivorans]|uniref:AsnC family transcriptional regulator n=1 Tax=Arenicella chitinivorans TaxID=1329800 RepID=A0A918RM71_9GAMM|nr:Lrp/AsnC family transcriptional regulator [Arenicella chitinivorans]GHA04607.1 AsnC family transcriptional regulator [Arenicella chitinivorans]